MSPRSLVEKNPDTDLPREMIGFAADGAEVAIDKRLIDRPSTFPSGSQDLVMG